jgi:hyperosmotically inducible protein
MNKLAVSLGSLFPALLLGALALGQSASPDNNSQMKSDSSTAVPADNTKRNQDPSNRGVTSDEQKNDKSDIDLAARIRQAVIADKGLSTYGHNVKIVALNGTVTLNGVVRSDEEKSQIEKKVAAIAGEGRVIDQLKVAPGK